MKPLVTMPDVLLACGELSKRERVAVQWVIDRYERERQGDGPHVHAVYEAVGGGYICSGCEMRFEAKRG